MGRCDGEEARLPRGCGSARRTESYAESFDSLNYRIEGSTCHQQLTATYFVEQFPEGRVAYYQLIVRILQETCHMAGQTLGRINCPKQNV